VIDVAVSDGTATVHEAFALTVAAAPTAPPTTPPPTPTSPLPPGPTTACSPRPRVQTTSVPNGGRLRVHVEPTPLNTQASNPLQRLRFDRLDNARVIVNGQAMANGQTYTVPAGATSVDFTVERVTPGQPTTVHVTAVDGCGEWRTFVGGGAQAGF
jgi:hypothetical protein